MQKYRRYGKVILNKRLRKSTVTDTKDSRMRDLKKNKGEKLMNDVYQNCPILQDEQFQLRLLKAEDWEDLLEVYSDEKSVPFFNADNCNGDTFYYTTEKRMKEAVDFWLMSYRERWFVRFTIVDRRREKAIGTIELFHRDAEERFPECGLLRLDLKSEYENKKDIESILRIILVPAKELFNCKAVVTKAVPEASERLSAMKKVGFSEPLDCLTGHDGKRYPDYYLWRE